MTELPPFRPSVSMLGWALNEEHNIHEYVRRAETLLRRVSEDFELVVIDDGSTDRTWQLLIELGRDRPWIRPLKNERNRGPGFCYRRAMAAASKDYFMAQTVDWAYDIDILARSFDYLRRYDVLQGVRPERFSWRAVRKRSDSLYKGIVSFSNYALIRFLFQLPFADFQNVTVCPARLVRPLEFQSESSFTNPEVMMKLYWRGATFLQVPVAFRKRERGRGTGTRVKSIVKSVSEIFRYWFSWIVLNRFPNRASGTVASLPNGELALPAVVEH